MDMMGRSISSTRYVSGVTVFTVLPLHNLSNRLLNRHRHRLLNRQHSQHSRHINLSSRLPHRREVTCHFNIQRVVGLLMAYGFSIE